MAEYSSDSSRQVPAESEVNFESNEVPATEASEYQFCTKNCGTKPFIEKKKKLLRGKKQTNYRLGKRQ